MKWEDSPDEVREYPVQLIRELCDPLLNGEKEDLKKPARVTAPANLTISDKEVLEIAGRAENSKKFSDLMKGNWRGYGYPSESEADAALAALLEFYTRGDSSQVERLMRSSGLNREKWNREDYLPRTIASAMSLVKTHYEPSYTCSVEESPKKQDTALSEPDISNIDNPRLKVNLPNNFVQKYIEYIHGMSDSYLEYQHGAALMLLSIAVNKRAYLPLTIGTIYTNVWVFCLGQSTVSRKTTACTKLTEFVELSNQWMLLSYPGSPEAFIEDLEGETRVNGPENNGHGILCRDEAGGILSSMEKSYMADMRDLFCQLYDCRPFTRKLRTSQRKAKTTFNIRDTYLNMFFATTPDIFSTYTKLEDLTSGWLLRFLYYFPNYEHKLRDLSTMSDDDRERQKKIGQHLQAIISFFKNHEVEFQFSIAGLTFYNDWKNLHLNQMQRERQEDRGMFDRLSIYALKMAMLYTIGRDAMVDELKPESQKIVKLDINDECLRVACEHVDQYFYPVSKIVFDTVGRNEDKNVLEKILGTIRRAGGRISRKNLMKRAHIKRKDLDDGLDTLFESTEVTKYLDDGGETWYTL
jgi:hypothetical protein